MQGYSGQGPWVTLSLLRTLAPQRVHVRLPESPLSIPTHGLSAAVPAVLSKEGLPCWGQSQMGRQIELALTSGVLNTFNHKECPLYYSEIKFMHHVTYVHRSFFKNQHHALTII